MGALCDPPAVWAQYPGPKPHHALCVLHPDGRASGGRPPRPGAVRCLSAPRPNRTRTDHGPQETDLATRMLRPIEAWRTGLPTIRLQGPERLDYLPPERNRRLCPGSNVPSERTGYTLGIHRAQGLRHLTRLAG